MNAKVENGRIVAKRHDAVFHIHRVDDPDVSGRESALFAIHPVVLVGAGRKELRLPSISVTGWRPFRNVAEPAVPGNGLRPGDWFKPFTEDLADVAFETLRIADDFRQDRIEFLARSFANAMDDDTEDEFANGRRRMTHIRWDKMQNTRARVRVRVHADVHTSAGIRKFNFTGETVTLEKMGLGLGFAVFVTDRAGRKTKTVTCENMANACRVFSEVVQELNANAKRKGEKS